MAEVAQTATESEFEQGPDRREKTTRKAKQVRVDEPHDKFGQEKATPPTVTLKADVSQYDEEDELEIGGRKLSKSERRSIAQRYAGTEVEFARDSCFHSVESVHCLRTNSRRSRGNHRASPVAVLH